MEYAKTRVRDKKIVTVAKYKIQPLRQRFQLNTSSTNNTMSDNDDSDVDDLGFADDIQSSEQQTSKPKAKTKQMMAQKKKRARFTRNNKFLILKS
jgi:hypothetical protein